MMRSFLLSPFSWRLAICASISFVLIVVLAVLVALASVRDWQNADYAYKKWNSGQGDRCKILFAQAEAEFKAIENNRCTYKEDLESSFKCTDSANRRKQNLLDYAYRGNCPSITLESGKFPTLRPPHDPASFIEFTLNSSSFKPLVFPVGFAALTVLLLLLTDVGRRFIMDRHVGWKRISLVLSVLSALIAFSWCWSNNVDFGQALTIVLATPVLSAAALIYGRGLFLWIAAGFSSSPPSVQMAAPVQLAQALVGAAPPATDTSEPLTAPSNSELNDETPVLETAVDATPALLHLFLSLLWRTVVLYLIGSIAFSIAYQLFQMIGIDLFPATVLFIKIKPSLLYITAALILLVAELGMHTNLVRLVMGEKLHISTEIWHHYIIGLSFSLLLLAALNMLVAATTSTETWISYKLFGALSLFLVSIFLMASYIHRLMQKDLKHHARSSPEA